MQLHTFRARSLAEALRLIRQELGPDASLLHTREVGSMLSKWLGSRLIEVTASNELAVPSRLPQVAGRAALAATNEPEGSQALASRDRIPGAELEDFRRKIREDLFTVADVEPSLVEQLVSTSARPRARTCPFGGSLWRSLHNAGVSDGTASRWLERLEAELACDPECHADRARERLRQIVAAELPIRGPIRLGPSQPTVVALVGPSGVGQTATLTQLAAHFCQQKKRRVGLITVDHHRAATVARPPTHTALAGLSVELVSTPHEMSAAVERLADHDLVLIDTDGVSPPDEVGVRQLRAILAAAEPNEVLLVLSCVADQDTFAATVRAFAGVGTTSLILTRLDEAKQLGPLLEWLLAERLPVSYFTDSQTVKGGIEAASAARLAERILPGGR